MMRRTLYFAIICAATLLPTLLCAITSGSPWSTAALLALPLEVAVLIVAYRGLFRPLHIIVRGMNLLREQDFASRLRHVGQPDADRMADIFNDMMERLKNQNLRIKEQNAFLEQLIDATPMGVLILDDKEMVTDANPVARRMLGIDSLPCQLHALPSPLAKAVAQLGRSETRTLRTGGRDTYRCSRLHFMDRGWPHPFMLLESLTEEVHQAERRTLTRVIRTMAHEVNNSMAGILSTLDTLGSILAEKPDTGSLVAPVQACISRSQEMTGFVQRFADVVKVPEPSLCLTDFEELVSSSGIFLESLCHRFGATLAIDVEQSSPVRMDPMLMQQALVNVVKNAAESAGRGGRVTIEAHGRALTVADNGPGLAPGAADQLFTALYTTKPDGHGLGLLLVAEILHRHNAEFSLRTEGSLTSFRILMP